MRDTNGWPTYSTWLMAFWLSAHRYGYMGEVVLAHWGRLRALPRGSLRAMAAVANKFERDVTANAAAITLFDNTTGTTMPATEAILAEVDWVAIADHALGRFEDYLTCAHQIHGNRRLGGR